VRFAYQSSIGDVPIDRLTERPIPGGNSIAWLLWHLARAEDIAVNTVIRGCPQVLTNGWAASMGVGDARMGTGFDDDEVAAFGESVEVAQVLAYWDAVGRETIDWLSDVDLDVLDTVPDVDARLAAADAVVNERASWVSNFWRGRPASFFLQFTAINHAYMHVGEISAVRGALGVPGL
jgi:hypothetical protein